MTQNSLQQQTYGGNMLAIGTDTEYFVKKQEVITHAIGMIGGTKDSPYIVERGNLQEDNVLAEFAIDPVRSVNDFIESIRSVEESLHIKLQENGLEMVKIPSWHFTKEQLLSWPSEAMVLGCSPDTNAWTGEFNPKPNARTTLRTAAGHVHFSYPAPNTADTCNIIKCLDYTLGLWSVLRDADTDRRNLYGKAGSCRLKAYGGEYRVLSNFWLADDADIALVYRITEMCVDNHRTLLPLFEGIVDGSTLQHIINTSDVGAAKRILPMIKELTDAELQ